MARYDTSGLDDIISMMDSMGESAGELAEEMVQAACEEIKGAWKESAQRHGLVDTGDMIGSINYKVRPTHMAGVVYNEVYPQGKDRKGVRNAEKAFILHYGRSNFAATYWVDDADSIADPRVEAVIREKFEAYMASRGG